MHCKYNILLTISKNLFKLTDLVWIQNTKHRAHHIIIWENRFAAPVGRFTLTKRSNLMQCSEGIGMRFSYKYMYECRANFKLYIIHNSEAGYQIKQNKEGHENNAKKNNKIRYKATKCSIECWINYSIGNPSNVAGF